MTTLATNHAGWAVEELVAGNGWVAVAGPFDKKGFAVGYCRGLKLTLPTKEYRVYEALTTKEKK